MVSRDAEHRVGLPMLSTRWLRQTFVHWAYEPEVVQRLVPPGVEVDTYEGAAWVGFTPFVMAAVRPGGLPPTRWSFPETNLRTYVRLPDGRDGLWFLSLEVTAPVLLGARTFGAPYHLASLAVRAEGDTVRYAGARRGGQPAYRLAVRPGAPVAPGPLDVWLTSRWRAFTRAGPTLWQIRVQHEPWSLRSAGVTGLEQTLTAAVGLPPPPDPAVVHYSPGVHAVRIAFPRPVAAAGRGTFRRRGG
ncbi:DUF2071 domain-containing protein [Streptomyces sp. NPDC046197]|uniref:YqjF family protein n=1 Tax=Streptomyces sp. NPDC046197 TaxID=3154337 RepID=UPI0033CFD02C